MLFVLSNGDRINLDNVNHVLTRDAAVELHFSNGTSRTVKGDDMGRLEAVLSGRVALVAPVPEVV